MLAHSPAFAKSAATGRMTDVYRAALERVAKPRESMGSAHERVKA
jgi:hypothetical protein